MAATSSSMARRPRTVRTTRCGWRGTLIVAVACCEGPRGCAGDGGADCESESSDLATSSSSSSGSEDAPLSFLTMTPTRPRGEPVSESDAGSAPPGRGVTGPTASISRQRWMSEDARGPAGGSSVGALALVALAAAGAATVEEASEGAGDGSRNTAARAATGRVAEASSESSASLARRRWSAGAGAADAAAAAQRSRIWRRRLGVGSLDAEAAEALALASSGEEEEKADAGCGGGMRMLKKPLDGVGREGSLHCADSWGMAATEEAMAVAARPKWGGRRRGAEPGGGRTASGRWRTRVRW
ncbi:unnamed protein product [Urochloa humidicola]